MNITVLELCSDNVQDQVSVKLLGSEKLALRSFVIISPCRNIELFSRSLSVRAERRSAVDCRAEGSGRSQTHGCRGRESTLLQRPCCGSNSYREGYIHPTSTHFNP